MANEYDDEKTTTRAMPAGGAFEAPAARIEVEDRTYGSRFAHDEHHAGAPDVEPDGEEEIEQMNGFEPWDVSRLGRVLAIGLAGATMSKFIRRTTKRQRRIAIGSALGMAAVAIGVGAWLGRREA